MLKRIAFFFIILILCGTAGFAQNNKKNIQDEDTYNKLVSYCNCKYGAEYIKLFYKNNVHQDLLKKLESCKIDDDLSKLEIELKKTRYPSTVYKSNRVYNPNSTDSVLFYSLFYDQKINLSSVDTKKMLSVNPVISDEITKYLNGTSQPKERVSNNRSDVKSSTPINAISHNSPSDSQSNNNHKSSPFWWIIIIAILLFILLLFLPSKAKKKIFQKKGNTLKKNYATIKKERDKFKEQNISLQQQIEDLKKGRQHQTANTRRTINEDDCRKVFKWILDKNEYCEQFSMNIVNNEQLCSLWIKNALKFPAVRKIIEETIPPKEIIKTVYVEQTGEKTMPETSPVNNKTIQTANNASVLYADAIIDGYFNRLSETPNGDTIFELHLQNEKVATFRVFSGANQLIIKRPEFLEGCDRQILTNAQKIQIENEGTAWLQTNGKWKIIDKLNVVIN